MTDVVDGPKESVDRAFRVRRLVTAFLFFAPGTRPQAGRWPTVWTGPKESDDKSSHSKTEPHHRFPFLRPGYPAASRPMADGVDGAQGKR